MTAAGFVFVGYDPERVRAALPSLAALRRMAPGRPMIQVANSTPAVTSDVFDEVITGSNHEMEFSAYDEGRERLLQAFPQTELVVFLNDTLSNHPGRLTRARAILELAGSLRDAPAILGEEDAGEFSAAGAELFGETVHGWISTWLFALNRPALDAIGPIRDPQVSALELNDRASIEPLLASFPPALRRHLRGWLFGRGGWKFSTRLDEANAAFLGGKLKSILHEFMLTARVRSRGAVIDLKALEQPAAERPGGSSPPRQANVSVLIPARGEPQLAQAIASVLAQGFEAVELIVGDSSRGAVESVLSRFDDPRIRHVRTHGGAGVAHAISRLWSEASHPLLMVLFEDDLLMPHALSSLVDLAEQQADAAFYFGNGYLIDRKGMIVAEPESVPDGEIIALGREGFVDIAARMKHPAGEFSNVLVNRASGVDEGDMLHYRGSPVEVMFDVALSLNASSKAPGVGVGHRIASRRRAKQTGGADADVARLWSEWERLVRGEYAEGILSRKQALAALRTAEEHYAGWTPDSPGLAAVQRRLRTLREKVEADDRSILVDVFQADGPEADDLVRPADGPPPGSGAGGLRA